MKTNNSLAAQQLNAAIEHLEQIRKSGNGKKSQMAELGSAIKQLRRIAQKLGKESGMKRTSNWYKFVYKALVVFGQISDIFRKN